VPKIPFKIQNELGNVSLFKNVITRHNVIMEKENSNIIIFNDIVSRYLWFFFTIQKKQRFCMEKYLRKLIITLVEITF